jgi:hypothetical protein
LRQLDNSSCGYRKPADERAREGHQARATYYRGVRGGARVYGGRRHRAGGRADGHRGLASSACAVGEARGTIDAKGYSTLTRRIGGREAVKFRPNLARSGVCESYDPKGTFTATLEQPPVTRSAVLAHRLSITRARLRAMRSAGRASKRQPVSMRSIPRRGGRWDRSSSRSVLHGGDRVAA